MIDTLSHITIMLSDLTFQKVLGFDRNIEY